jgi:hypothetical protein
MKMKQMIYWFSLLVSSVVVVMNVMVLSEHEFFIVDAALEFSNRVRDEFVLPILPRGKGSVHNTDITVSAIKDPFNLDPRVTGSYSGYLLAKGGSRASSSSSSSAAPLSGNFRRSRTLLGIISANTRNDCAYRKRHRKLFQIWNDTRVCSLAELQQKPEWQRKDCQLVYTFVIGAADDGDDNNITQIVNSTIPLYRSTPLSSKFPDVNEGDITLLNIKYVYAQKQNIGWMWCMFFHGYFTHMVNCPCLSLSNLRENMNEGSTYILVLYGERIDLLRHSRLLTYCRSCI